MTPNQSVTLETLELVGQSLNDAGDND